MVLSLKISAGINIKKIIVSKVESQILALMLNKNKGVIKEMRIAKLTDKGIMVNAEEIHRLGPIQGTIATIASLFDLETKYFSVRFEGKEITHFVIDPPNEDMKIPCGLKCGGEARMWALKLKKVTCKKCKQFQKRNKL